MCVTGELDKELNKLPHLALSDILLNIFLAVVGENGNVHCLFDKLDVDVIFTPLGSYSNSGTPLDSDQPMACIVCIRHRLKHTLQ